MNKDDMLLVRREMLSFLLDGGRYDAADLDQLREAVKQPSEHHLIDLERLRGGNERILWGICAQRDIATKVLDGLKEAKTVEHIEKLDSCIKAERLISDYSSDWSKEIENPNCFDPHPVPFSITDNVSGIERYYRNFYNMHRLYLNTLYDFGKRSYTVKILREGYGVNIVPAVEGSGLTSWHLVRTDKKS